MRVKKNRLMENIPVVILAGGQGTRVGSADLIPKAMVMINGAPMLQHVVSHYRQAGFRKFIVCAGLNTPMIKEAALRLKGDITVVDTGMDNMTGSRLAQVRSYVEDAPFFCCSYADTVSDIDFQALVMFHRGHQKTATLAAVHLTTRFRILGLYGDDDLIRGFTEEPMLEKDYINGGFYVFNSAIFRQKTLKKDKNCVLETSVLEGLITQKDICAFKHNGFWQCVDTERDRGRISAWISSKVEA
jgi:glucose-1-phosphate cytidylyltransferase